MIYSLMPLRNQEKEKLDKAINSINLAVNKMKNKNNFKLIIFKDGDTTSVLPEIQFEHEIIVSDTQRKPMYARLEMLKCVGENDYWFDTDSDDEISEDFLVNVEKEIENNWDLITANVLTDSGYLSRYETLADIYIETWLHGLVFKKSVLKQKDIDIMYELNDAYGSLCYGEDLLMNLVCIPNVTSFKHVDGLYIYHNALWGDLDAIEKKYPMTEKEKFIWCFERLAYEYPATASVIYYGRSCIRKVWEDLGITLNSNIIDIGFINRSQLGVNDDVHGEMKRFSGESVINDKNENITLCVPISEKETGLAHKILSLIMDICFCCYKGYNVLIFSHKGLFNNTYISDDWYTDFFKLQDFYTTKKFIENNPIKQIISVYDEKSHDICNKIYKTFFQVNDKVKNSIDKINLDYDNTTAVILRGTDYITNHTARDNKFRMNIDDITIDTDNVFIITEDKTILEKFLKKFPNAIYYNQIRPEHTKGYLNNSISDEDFAKMQYQYLFQLEEAAKCKQIKSEKCGGGYLVSVMTDNEFKYFN